MNMLANDFIWPYKAIYPGISDVVQRRVTGIDQNVTTEPLDCQVTPVTFPQIMSHVMSQKRNAINVYRI